MVQNVSWEWLLEGFKYELEVEVKPKTVNYYYSHARVFTRWAQHRGQLANPHLTTKRHVQDFFHYLLYDWHTIGGIITLIVAGIKKLTERGVSRASPTRKSNPLDVAKERYSKGDFTRGEFEEIKKNKKNLS